MDALTEIADTDPLLRYCVDTITHEIVISFLGTVQLEVICSLLIEKYHINIRIEDPTVIYLEKPLQKADYTIHIEVPPNPFWAYDLITSLSRVVSNLIITACITINPIAKMEN